MSQVSGQPSGGEREPFQLLPTFGGLIRSLALLVVVAMLVGTVALFVGWRPSADPGTRDPGNRSGSPVLQSLTDLSEFHAASAHYETVVDLEDDTQYLPGLLSGERVLYVGKGDVDAVVDFGQLDESRVQVSEDGMTVTVRLPAPVAGKPTLDLENSYVVLHDKGLVNRFRGSDLERRAQLEAVEQLSSSANQEGLLTDRAKENTTAMLRGLFGSLGFTSITVTYDEDPR